VEKVSLFCNPASGGTFSSTAIEIEKWVTKFAVGQAKVSHILRPGHSKNSFKLVNDFERKYQRIHALKKEKTKKRMVDPLRETPTNLPWRRRLGIHSP
jgi:hypothetical protein